MSGIAGILSSNRLSDQQQHQKDMLVEAMRRRGPDGIETYETAQLFLAHGHLGNTDYRVSNLQDPLSDIKIIGDVRLDNRQDLIAELCPKDGEQEGTEGDPTDLSLLLLAYGKWGRGLCAYLIGDFAFAIWDPHCGQLVCGRDHFGVRPFYYRDEDGMIGFSSDEAALGADPYDLEEDMLADMLVGSFDAPANTAHPGIHRLRPAHVLIWQAGEVTTERYWTLALRPQTTGDPEARFRDLFEAAVKARMRDDELASIGSMLSGGLDSSAVSLIAAKHLERQNGGVLPVYSLVFEQTPALDERPYIEAVLQSGSFHPRQIACDHIPAFEGMDTIFREQSGFHIGPNNAVGRKTMEEASKDGIQILLDGHGGDEVVWHGLTRVDDLARAGQWLQALVLVETACRIYDESRLLAGLNLIASHAKPRFVRRAARVLRRLKLRAEKDQSATPSWHRVVKADFAERSGLWHRHKTRAAAGHNRSDQEMQLAALTSPVIELAFEALDRTAASKQLEIRYPFFDVRLVEFCLNLPSSQKLRRHETRSILRRALSGVLPDLVRDRQDKTSFLPAMANGILDHHQTLMDDMLANKTSALYRYVERDRLRILIETFKEKGTALNGHDMTFIWRVLSLYIWLEMKNSAHAYSTL